MTAVAVVGAGVIGQVYAGRLAEAGHTVYLLARGTTLGQLRGTGVRLRSADSTSVPTVHLAASALEIPEVDFCLLAVRADQVDAAIETVSQIRASTVLTLVNLAGSAEEVGRRIGSERVVFGFPGVGGSRDADGVSYHEIAQQPTMIGAAGGREGSLVDLISETGMPVQVSPDPLGWLASHAVFIVGVGAAVLAAGGSAEVGRSRRRTKAMVLGIRDGFSGVGHRGYAVAPPALRTIFTRVPTLFSVPYWQRQMSGTVGSLAIAPHVMATRDTEFAHLVAATWELTDAGGGFDALLESAGFHRDRAEGASTW